MRKRRVFSVFVTLVLVAGTSAAANWSNVGKIRQIYFSSGHNGVLITHDHMSDPDGCGRQDLFILRSDNPLFKEMYATMLAAHLVGQPLNLYLSGCHQGFPSIVNIISTDPA